MKKRIVMGVAVILLGFAWPLAADEAHDKRCDEQKKDLTYVGRMGMVDLETLESHIELMERRLARARKTEAKSSRHRKTMEKHMDEMLAAMDELSGVPANSDCVFDPKDADLTQRVELIERRLGVIEAMLRQIVGHQREIEREQAPEMQ